MRWFHQSWRPVHRYRGRPFLFALLLPFLLVLGWPSSGSAGELSGAQLFLACAGCHSLEQDAPHGVGPNLYGLAGRKAGSAGGFVYSPALQEADITWNAGTLTAWIVRTEAMVPGTWMLYHNHLEAEEVNRLVEYLLEPGED